MTTQIIVAASLSVANAILDESALSFLGYGVALPKSSWGSMLQNAQQYILYDPLLALIPGAFILLTVLCLNILGDVLQHALDPTLTIGCQIAEKIMIHTDMKKEDAWKEAERLLTLVGIPIPDPKVKEEKQRIRLEGEPPSPIDPPDGCRFQNRCSAACERCFAERPELREVEPGHWVACHLVK